MELLTSETARWMIAAWFFCLGGAVGSFLNVVVYRLPAGMSISWPGSHCPRCKHAIRAYDNVPVLAWLWLRGRCRDCHERISFRYPLVEAITAGLFLLLFVVEVLGGGQNLPLRTSDGSQPYSATQTLRICFFHLALLSTLLAAALIQWDGRRLPRRLYVPSLLVGLLTPPIWPWLHPQPAHLTLARSAWSGMIDSLVGLVAGLILGGIAESLGRRFRPVVCPGNQVLGPALLIGVVLGWQAVVVLVPLAWLLETLSHAAARRWASPDRCAAAVWITPLTLCWILNWVNWIRLAAWLRLV